MRTQPTFFNNATLQFDWNAVANLGVFNSPVLVTNKSNNKDIEIDGTVTGGTQGQAGAIILASPTAGQYVSFNAEL
jgi:ribosomal protein S9